MQSQLHDNAQWYSSNLILLFVVFFAREVIKYVNMVTNTLALVAKWVPWKFQKLFAQEIDKYIHSSSTLIMAFDGIAM